MELVPPLVRATNTCCYQTRCLCHKYMNTFYEQLPYSFIKACLAVMTHCSLFNNSPKQLVQETSKILIKGCIDWLRITVYWIIYVLEDDRCIFQRFSMSHPEAEEREWVARNQQWCQALKLRVCYLLLYRSFISTQENSLEVKKVSICLCSKLYIILIPVAQLMNYQNQCTLLDSFFLWK